SATKPIAMDTWAYLPNASAVPTFLVENSSEGSRMILILTEPLDEHADWVAQKLRECGADFVRFNPADFPSKSEVSLLYSRTGQARFMLRVGEEIIDLTHLTAVWYRRPDPPTPHENINDAITRDYVQEECKTFLNDAWSSLDCLWVPAPHPVIQRAQLKAS